MKISLSSCICVCVISSYGNASAFNADGLSAGMSKDKAIQTITSSGYDVWETIGNNFSFGEKSSARINGNLWFCDGKLFSVSRSLDFDSDYYLTVNKLVSDNGQPTKLSLGDNPWNGVGGGSVRWVETQWQKKDYEIALSVIPEGRGSSGSFKYGRAMHLSYRSKLPCSTIKK
jgi:hypothetical protein